MSKKVLNEEIHRIKDMMKKINESRFFDDKGEFLGGPDPSQEGGNGGLEYFGEEVDAFMNDNFPEMTDNLNYDYSSYKDRHGDFVMTIGIKTKDGSELSDEFRQAVHDAFNVSDEDEGYIQVSQTHAGPELDFE